MAKYVIGLDIGGTKIHSLVAEWDKDFLTTRKLPKIVKSNRTAVVNKNDGGKFFEEIVSEIKSVVNEIGENSVERIGLGIAGPLSKDKVMLNPPNLPFKNFPILKKLEKRFNAPVYVDNDANCFAWAEHLFGAARASSSTLGITLGTGVGGGLVIDIDKKSVLYDGYNGSATEVGHMILDKDRSFEDLCSSHAQYLWRGIDPLIIEQKALAGDKASREIYNKYGFWLGVGIANCINFIDPQMIVLGGSLSNAWDLFEKEMNITAKKYIISTLAKKTKIVRAKLGDDAAALGAAYLI